MRLLGSQQADLLAQMQPVKLETTTAAVDIEALKRRFDADQVAQADHEDTRGMLRNRERRALSQAAS